MLDILPEVWPPIILVLFLEDFVGFEKSSLQYLRSSVHLIFHTSSLVRPRGRNCIHCLVQSSEEELFLFLNPYVN